MQQSPDDLPHGGTPPAGPRKSNTTIIIIVIVIAAAAVPVAIALIGVFASLGIYGTRRYLSNAKSAEGRANVTAIARGAVLFSEGETASGGGALPASAPAVPSSLSMVSGKKYASAASDWEAPGWKELHFQVSVPQYFQYVWERSSATEGVARAVADLNGDGVPEVTFEVPVTCTGTPPACTSGPIAEKQ